MNERPAPFIGDSMEASSLTPERITNGLRVIAELNGNNLVNAVDRLGVSPEDKAGATKALKGLLGGDKAFLAELEAELAGIKEIDAASKSGGRTDFKVHKKWGIPYAQTLYIGHDIVQASSNLSEAVALVVGAIPGINVVLVEVAVAAAFLAGALRVLDRGRGIMITQAPIGFGPWVPTPQ
jgi:hypothetical protein